MGSPFLRRAQAPHCQRMGAAAESVPLFLAFRFLMGFSGASGIVIARAIARDVCKGPELTPEGASFGDLLKQAMQEVDAAQHTAHQEARNLMTGEATDMHTAILAVQKADVSFQMMMAVRGKLIDAYREVMRMQM